MDKKQTPYQMRFAPKNKKIINKTIPKPQPTGLVCQREGCEHVAVGDGYCSRQCCQIDNGLPPHTGRKYERKI